MEIYFKNGSYRILAFGCYKEHKWTILSHGVYPTAYVENKIGVKYLWDKRLKRLNIPVTIHYCDTPNWDTDDRQTVYLGWDYGHLGDFLCLESGDFDGHRWTYEEILAEVYNVIDQLVELEEKLEKGEK